MLSVLFSLYLKMLVLYSPFFVLSCFLGLTPGYSVRERKKLAWKVALGTLVASVLLYLFGQTIFEIFGITADAFRIGAGSVLFISALGMAQGKSAVQADNVQQDVTIVPLTIPLTVGPGTIGALLVMGISQPHWDDKLLAIIAIGIASVTVGVVLYLSDKVERLLGQQGLQILSRLMGLFVCALAAQIIFTGVRGYLAP
ncbi:MULTISPECIES: MarC family protein [unclassified Pseudomonas]|jgi:multiple antibiotic resistance protein|uniref:MarC family protein n=1 Tax=unclassified Pseudomonas TaxID=196821 RepID=UPI00244CDC86|nr:MULTISPECIES: MarC family protein [unclassified Pseudomonas]MDG9928587.1 MarC family protein [Pseudomonas sp. GD04042]MDH0482757.1 MarC family protein [Pseudomonas sp. GD04015]MDH0607141.1 MarC family protein [Pseudomonas sp. GD03869]